MNYLSVCSGIEAATVAWHDMGWNPLAFSEIEKFPSQVLAHHYPNTPNLGGMTKFKEWDFGTNRLDLLVGGTPCQSFSVAGLRKGLEDPRGNLALTYVAILNKFRPKWCIWENVPGVLSSGKGRDFGAFLGALGELGYGWAYRVLDAKNFGVAQRRRRVFVVGCLGGWESAAKVLFESESLLGNIKQSRKKREETSTDFIPSIANCLETTCNDYSRADGFNMIAQPTISFDERNIQFFSNQNYTTCPTLTATDNKGAKAVCYENHGTDSRIKEIDVSPTVTARWGTGGNNVPLAMQGNLIGRDAGGPNGIGVSDSNTMYTLTKTDVHAVVTGFNSNARPDEMTFLQEQSNTLTTSQNSAVFCDTYNGTIQGDVAATMTADMAGPTHSGPKVMQNMAVRRFTEVECERLQGFPDNYTNIKENCPSGARYKSLGNSMAVPVMKWIGQRIQQVENGLI